MNKRQGQALVVGAGISGVRSALDLAEAGCRVTLIDAAPNMGGVLAQLEHQFPTDGCGMCRMLPTSDRDSVFQGCLRKGLIHENVEVKLLTRLVKVEGEPGNLRATLESQAPVVDPERCIGCNLCFEVCPVTIADPFNLGLSNTRAIHLPVPHAVPNIYTIDLDHCTLCGECAKVCPFDAITLPGDREGLLSDAEASSAGKSFKEVEVGAVILATGVDYYDPATGINTFGYRIFKDVVTNLELERILSQTGPFEGELRRPSDGRVPRRMAWIQCVGSRQRDFPVCSSICCMIALKEAVLVRKLSGFTIETVVYFMDMRCSGKEFEAYRRRAENEYGVILKRARPHSVYPVEERDSESAQGQGSNSIPESAQGSSLGSGSELDSDMERGPESRPNSGSYPLRLKLTVSEDSGKTADEIFDMVVLSVGQRPPQANADLVTATQLSLDSWGFLAPQVLDRSLDPDKKIGVFIAGSASGLKEIGESVIFSSWAANQALGTIRSATSATSSPGADPGQYPGSKSGSKGTGQNDPAVFRDVSRQMPDIGVVVCQCPNLPDAESQISALALGDVHVSKVIKKERICTRAGWDDLIQTLGGESFNRLLVVVCNPMFFLKKKNEFSLALALDPAYVEFVGVGGDQPVTASVGMGLARIRHIARLNIKPSTMVPKVLVVGGGIGGMTAALGIARAGFEAVLVERSSQLGGNLNWLDRGINGEDFKELLKATKDSIKKTPGITVLTNAVVDSTRGGVGRYSTVVRIRSAESNPVEKNPNESTVEDPSFHGSSSMDSSSLGLKQESQKTDGKAPDELKEIIHGAVILATGGKEAKTTAYGHGKNPVVMTNQEVERALKQGSLDFATMNSVVMIQCVDSREDRAGARPYCSRICCASSLKHALELKRLSPELAIYVLYREMMTQGFTEAYYKEARDLGVIFIRYSVDKKPEVNFESDHAVVGVIDPILDRPLEIRADLVVLATGVAARQLKTLTDIFNAKVDRYSFFDEADPKWRPVDSLGGGVFSCGLALGPRNVEESIASAGAAAMGAVRLISTCGPAVPIATAAVKQSLCSVCEQCIKACVFGARSLDPDTDRIMIDPVLCQGCGACASVCPNSAAYVNNFLDQQMFEVIDAAF